MRELCPPHEFQYHVTIMIASLEEEANEAQNYLSRVIRALKSSEMKKALYSGCAIQVLQQFLGVKTILYYLPTILDKSEGWSLVLTYVLPTMDCVGTLLGVFVVDKIGRRRLILISFCSIVLGGLLFGIQYNCDFNMQKCSHSMSTLAAILYIFYILLYTPGMETVPWIVNVEFYPHRYRSIGGGIAAIANWVSNFIVSKTSDFTNDKITVEGTFMLYSLISIFVMVFVYKVFPETSGIPLENTWRVFEIVSSSSSSRGSLSSRQSNQLEETFSLIASPPSDPEPSEPRPSRSDEHCVSLPPDDSFPPHEESSSLIDFPSSEPVPSEPRPSRSDEHCVSLPPDDSLPPHDSLPPDDSAILIKIPSIRSHEASE